MQIVLLSALIVGLTGLILGALIAVMAKLFIVKSDPRIAEVAEKLPGANCGGCGFAGCADLAKNIVEKNLPAETCPVSSEKQIEAINCLLGRASAGIERKVAVVLCSGSCSLSGRKAGYNGVTDCRNAALVANGGGKSCRFGCLGYATCVRACKFNAIEIVDGLAIVHSELCKGCGQCVSVCPRKLIKLVPATTTNHIYCNSLDKPVTKRKGCSTSCIGCQKCVRALGKEKINPQGFLVRLTYSTPVTDEECRSVQCPTGVFCSVSDHYEKIVKAAKKGE